MYTSYDGDWSEAANLLKMLSRHLYCLQWLDLTGCGDWFVALSVANGAEWNGAWRGIEYVRLGVGWSPDWTDGPVQDPDKESEHVRKRYYYGKAVEKYMEILGIARGVANLIRFTRSGRGKWIEFDLSPELPAVR